MCVIKFALNLSQPRASIRALFVEREFGRYRVRSGRGWAGNERKRYVAVAIYTLEHAAGKRRCSKTHCE